MKALFSTRLGPDMLCCLDLTVVALNWIAAIRIPQISSNDWDCSCLSHLSPGPGKTWFDMVWLFALRTAYSIFGCTPKQAKSCRRTTCCFFTGVCVCVMAFCFHRIYSDHSHTCWILAYLPWSPTLQETNISHLWKRNIIFSKVFWEGIWVIP